MKGLNFLWAPCREAVSVFLRSVLALVTLVAFSALGVASQPDPPADAELKWASKLVPGLAKYRSAASLKAPEGELLGEGESTTSSTGNWLGGKSGQVWVNRGSRCLGIPVTWAGDALRGSVAICSKRRGKKVIETECSVSIGTTFEVDCHVVERPTPQWLSPISGSAPTRQVPGALLGVDPSELRFGPGTYLEAACTMATSHQTCLGGGSRVCEYCTELQLIERPLVGLHRFRVGRVGMASNRPVDCSVPCPEGVTDADQERMAALLKGRVFVALGKPTFSAYRSLEACQGISSSGSGPRPVTPPARSKTKIDPFANEERCDD